MIVIFADVFIVIRTCGQEYCPQQHTNNVGRDKQSTKASSKFNKSLFKRYIHYRQTDSADNTNHLQQQPKHILADSRH